MQHIQSVMGGRDAPVPMWSQTPGHPAYQGITRKAASTSSTPGNPLPQGPGHRVAQSVSNFLEPALEGPPSPERLRALSNQLRRTSLADRPPQSSSGASSLRSQGSDRRPSWERSLENLSLSRRSSQRSTSSSMPSRDRPDSVQILGKSLFSRKGKLRRESSEHGLANSSVYGKDVSAEPKEPNLFNAMLSRRKASKSENVLPSKKLQISGPYNFQHVTHTPKASLPDIYQGNRGDLATQFSEVRWDRSRQGSVASTQTESIHFRELSSDGLPIMQQDPSAGTQRGRASSFQQGPSSPQRLIKRTQSQEQIRMAPPRPPRSPLDHKFISPVAPPPRLSSRASLKYDGLSPINTSANDRPSTGPGFRQPKPFVLTPATEVPEEYLTDGEPSPSQSPKDTSHRFSHAVTTPDDAAWPMSSNAMTSLPDVPEEEESHGMPRQPKISVTTTSPSSLRGSVSVPLLRQFTQNQSATVGAPAYNQRNASNASETLGRFDIYAAHRALQASIPESRATDDFPRESWEDDIDYCYDHAAEADCDFEWGRASCDMGRADDGSMMRMRNASNASRLFSNVSNYNSLLHAPSPAETPALSPSSQTSTVPPSEAVTPAAPAAQVTSNFSRPRRDSSALVPRIHSRTTSHASSHASSVKESSAFSPSLLIPSDYQEQSSPQERGEPHREPAAHEGANHIPHVASSPCLDSISGFDKSAAVLQARSSASTTDSALSEQSFASSRHKSTLSSSTGFTRYTANSSVESWNAPAEEDEHTVCGREDDTLGSHSPSRTGSRTASRGRNSPPAQYGLFPSDGMSSGDF